MQNKDIYRRRINKLCRWLKDENIAAAVIRDAEGMHSPNLRYLSGMPSEALLFILPADPGNGYRADRSILIPWDAVLAKKIASADEIIPYGKYGRQFGNALKGILDKEGIPKDARIELPSSMPHHQYINFLESETEEKSKSSRREYLCRAEGFESVLDELRMVKDEEELKIIREGSRLTNRLIAELEMEVRKGALGTEIDVALFIERRSRTLGCEGTGFETITAGPGRSWGIHAFPLFTAGDFGTKGFSLVDFGVSYSGYATDVTMSFIRGPLSKKQEEMVSLVEEAYKAVAAMLAPGVTTMEVSKLAAEIFEKKNWVMPHALGHGYGLDVHEAPFLRSAMGPDIKLKPGMVLAVEPGLYHEAAGGIRWENDFLITETGCECLTTSTIIRLPD